MLDRPKLAAAFLGAGDTDLDAFRMEVERETDPALCPNADEIARGIPVYDGTRIEAMQPRAVMAEWVRVLRDGPGVIAIRGAVRDRAMLDRTTEVLLDLIAREGAGAGDHFAASGANARLWNAHEKLCLADPELFVAYASTPALALASEAWLGPMYQITAQVNLVRPGGRAQTGHRDYHMGFMADDALARFPLHAHTMSPFLTLQGAIAHSDMPIESGPTKLLPHSQRFAAGYAAFGRDDFQAYFEENYVQLPLAAGDAVFFSPALFHAAGDNDTTDHERFANLFQVGSAMGRTLEALDRIAMCRAVLPILRSGTLDAAATERAIAATAEGYPFPTDLDRDPPTGGMAPKGQADLLREAVAQKWDDDRFAEALDVHAAKRAPSSGGTGSVR